MVIQFIKRSHLHNSLPGKLSNVALFMALAFGAFDSVWSIYIDSFVHSEAIVGFISTAFTFVAIVAYALFTPIIEKYSEIKLWLLSSLGIVLSYLLFTITDNLMVIFLGAFLLVVFKSLHFIVRGILLCDSCKKRELGKVQGMFGAIRNIGWMLGPLIAGFIASKLGAPTVFLFCTVFVLIGIGLFRTIRIRECNHKTKDDGTFKSTLKNIKIFFSKKKLIVSYIVSGGLSLYWAILYVYVPLFIIRNNMPEYMIGIFLFLVPLPLVMLEYSMGKVADKRGYKRLFSTGYLIVGFFALLAYFAPTPVTSLGFIVLGSIGAAFIETNKESHFFSIISKSEEEKFYGPYRTHMDLFSLIGKGGCAIILLYFPIQIVFLVAAVSMLTCGFAATQIKGKH